MLKNYFVIAIRHLVRHKLFSIINVFCLAIGITFSMIIGVYVLNQENVNSNIKNINNQYFIKTIWKEKDLGLAITSLSPLAKSLKEEYPTLVENYYRYNPVTNVVSAGDRYFKEDIAIGDTTLVTMFNFQLLHGDKTKAFNSISSAVITKTMAMKLFGKTDVIGKTISVQTTVAGVSQDYIVSAVLKDIPNNSVTNLLGSAVYNVFIPTAGNLYYKGGDPSLDWTKTSELSFLELKKNVEPKDLRQPINTLIRKYSADFIWNNLSEEKLVPLKDYYLNDNNGAVKKMITTLSLISIFILVMVIINFVNINIGISSYRLKEIGLRKVFGSGKKQLIIQFILEAWILSLIATLLSVVAYEVLLPFFSKVLIFSLQHFWEFNYIGYLAVLLLLLLIGFIAGIYPAFILSSVGLTQAVKGKVDSSKGGIAFKRILLVVQFSLATIVFICALNISRQVSYIFSKDLGYKKEQLLVLTAFPKQWDSAGVARMETIKQNLLQLPSVKSGSLAFDLPEGTPKGQIIVYPPGKAGTNDHVNLPIAVADEDYAKTFGLQIIAGSFFNENKDGIVLNEMAVRMLGLKPENAVGKKIETPIKGAPITIKGVLKDCNFSSMQDKIGPIGFTSTSSNNIYRYLVIKFNPTNVSETISAIKAKWKSLSPAAPFEYSFMDEKFKALYSAELQLKSAAGLATALNLIIVFMGIFGIVAFTLTKRNKEIAIRKVLGADVRKILLLFIKEYGWLIFIANVFAWPLAYIISNKWLENYAYRIQQNAVPYLIVCAFVFIAAFVLIAVQCFKVAVENPVKSMRTE